MTADISKTYNFTPDFSHVRSLAHLAATQGVSSDKGKAAILEGLALCCAWPADGSLGHGLTRAEVLTYFEQAVFQGKRRFKTMAGAALFGPSKPEYGVEFCTQRTVIGVLVEPDFALHPHADLRTWVVGQAGAQLQLVGQDASTKAFKVVPNVYQKDKGLLYGLFAHQGTVREASGPEVAEFLTMPSPVCEPARILSLADVTKDRDLAAEAAPFWKWADAKIIGSVK